MIRARLKLAVEDRQVAHSLIRSVEPDNRMDNLMITGRAGPGSLVFDMKFDGEIETFIFTLDDLLRCLQAANETLQKIETERV